MESVNLDMEDIFDEQEEEEDFPSVRPLPDLPDADQTEDQANGEDDENSAEVLSRLKDLSKGAAKKVVRKPQPKLDATRLTGERGIPVLPKLFEDVKFKGKGHEAQDLQIIMRYLEHWAHRLFPKMPFDEVLERIEKLGTKNEVKTCIKKMRLDMPVLNEDFIKNNDGEDDIDDNTDKNKQGDIDADAEEVFDEMMRAESESPASKTSAPRPTSHLATQLALPLSENPSDPMATGTPKPNSSNSQALSNTDKMESVNLDMEDIFDEQEEEEDFPSVRPLPDLPDADQTEDQANGEDDENSAEVLSRLKDLSKGAAKKVVRKPQPKLDATRLTGERGIPVLPKLFEDVKFKGKGHEAQDLQIIMRYLEHWAHRLFPKMPFDEVLERIEKLGTKNEVKTCIKKMRLDMPVLNEDFIKNNDGEDDIDDNTDKNKQGDIDADAEEVFDEMMRAESESPASKTSAPRPTSHLATQLALPLSENPSDPMATGTPKPNSSNSQALSNGLTPEQRERMERNKRLAMEKRMNKHGPFKTPAPPSPRTPSRKVVSHTVNSSQGSPARMGPSSSQGSPAHFGPSSSQGSPTHTGISHGGVIQNNFVMPQSPSFSSYHSPTKCHQAAMQHSPQQLPPYIGDGVGQATFRTLVDQSMNRNSSEMSTVYPMMNGNFLGQNTLSMNCPSQSMGNSSIASSDGYFPAVGSNPYNNSSQEMSEVYPVPHQNVQYTNSQSVQVRSDEHGQSQSIPLVNVDSKVYADLSSPKKARLDTSRSSEQMSEEELMLHLSESE